jgi:hypothetical protein
MWRFCANHRQARSEYVCPSCQKGYCNACTQRVQTAAICLQCDVLCVTAARYGQDQTQEQQRARSMMREIGVIATYPFNDGVAYIMLALFTGFFGFFSIFPIAYVLSAGVLVWYSFNAISKVSIGKLDDVMPDFSDLSDITSSLWLSLASLVISLGPLYVGLLLGPGLDLLRSGGAHGEVSSLVHDWALLLFVLGASFWALVYMPVALMVAALSRSVASTLNPLIGIDTIKKMGGTYWQALGVYCVIVFVQRVAASALESIPVAGGLLMAFVDSWAALAIGCTLGLAVFQKAAELDWD